MPCKESAYLGNCWRPLKLQKGHLPTENSKEITETKLYKKAASQVIHGALDNPLSRYGLVFLSFLNFKK